MLKGALDEIWGLFLTLQIISFIGIYEAGLPSIVEIYLQELRSLVNFEFLKVSSILHMIDKDLDVAKLLGYGSKLYRGNHEGLGIQSDKFWEIMLMYLIPIVFFGLFLAIVILLTFIKPF